MKGVGWFLFRWFLRLLPLAIVVAFLHYSLPGHDIVRIVGTEVNRMDQPVKTAVEQDAVSGGSVTRDVRFINTVRPNGKPSVYRNEDTDWGFPWYFKFDSGNLQAQAQDLISDKDDPEWVLITHYGWRIEILSMFPNAVAIKPVASPDHTVIPWFNIVFLTLLAVLLFFVIRGWLRFMRRLAIDERFENASNSVAQIWRWTKANLRDGRRKLLGSG